MNDLCSQQNDYLSVLLQNLDIFLANGMKRLEAIYDNTDFATELNAFISLYYKKYYQSLPQQLFPDEDNILNFYSYMSYIRNSQPDGVSYNLPLKKQNTLYEAQKENRNTSKTSPNPEIEMISFFENLNPYKTHFFIIKCASQNNILISQEKNVWASTRLGTKRLIEAYRNGENSVYLIFSINGSGMFCGIGKMESDVYDETSSRDLWDLKNVWTRDFEMNWLISKNIPNKCFRHLTVPENENKPVTQSRDTQEIPFSVGLDIISIFKTYKEI